MEILRFAKWWWDKSDAASRVLATVIPWILFMVISTYFATVGVVLVIFFAGLGIAGLLYLFYQLYKAVSIQWRKYKEHRECEAQRIVNRLRGV